MDETTKIFPYCYKIKEDCPPCTINTEGNECVKLLANYLVLKYNRYVSKEYLEKAHIKVGKCLKKYGDIYKKLGIELYVNPKTKSIYFPDNERIMSNYNLFLNDIGTFEPKSPKEENIIYEKISLYQILLQEKMREVYNDFYKNNEFSELESIIHTNTNNNGGKKRKTIKNRLKRKTRTKKRIYKKN